MSLLKTKTEIIDGYEVTGTQLPAIQAWKLKTKILKLLGPALKDVNSSGLMDKQFDESMFIQALGGLVEGLDPDDFINLVLQLLNGVYISGNELQKKVHIGDKDSFNLTMAGKMVFVYKAIYFVLKLNFEDFFLQLANGIGSSSLGSLKTGA